LQLIETAFAIARRHIFTATVSLFAPDTGEEIDWKLTYLLERVERRTESMYDSRILGPRWWLLGRLGFGRSRKKLSCGFYYATKLTFIPLDFFQIQWDDVASNMVRRLWSGLSM
jgi:hypothetical protein